MANTPVSVSKSSPTSARNMCILATLTATFYASSDAHPTAAHANTIIPVTTLANNTGDEASVPPIFSVRHYPFAVAVTLMTGC